MIFPLHAINQHTANKIFSRLNTKIDLFKNDTQLVANFFKNLLFHNGIDLDLFCLKSCFLVGIAKYVNLLNVW